MNKSGKNGLELRLNAVVAAKKIGIGKSAELYSVSRYTVYRWLKNYTQAGINGLINKSKSEKRHPLKTSAKIRQQISDYFNENPQATAKNCVTELNLTVSTVTINKIRQASGSKKIPPVFNNRKCLYFGVEKIESATGTARYLFWCKEVTGGLVWSALCSYNSPQALGIFADYLLSYLKPFNPVVFYGKGNFLRGRKECISFFVKIVQEKHGLNLLAASFKIYPDNCLLNISKNSSTVSSEQQLYDLYTLQTGLNLKCKEENTEMKALPIAPLNVDKHLAFCQQILSNSTFWHDQQQKSVDKYRQTVEQFMQNGTQPAILNAMSLNELYDLFVHSGIKDNQLRTNMQLELGRALSRAGLQEESLRIYSHVAAIYAHKTDSEEYFQAINLIAESCFQRGLYDEATKNYLLLIKKINTAASMTSRMERSKKLVNIHLSAAESLKESGKFSQALNHFKLAEKMSTDNKQKQKIAFKRAMLFHIKGNHRQSVYLLQELLKEQSSRFLLTEIYRGLAMNYFFMWDYDSAEYYQRLQLKYIDKNTNPSDYAHTKFRIGVILYSKDKNCNQPSYFTEQLDFNQKQLDSPTSSKVEQIVATQRIAAVYNTTGKIDESIALHKKALLMCYEISDFIRMCHSYNILSNAFHSLGDYKLALKYRNKELTFLEKMHMFQDIYRAKRQIAHFYYRLGDSAKALQIYRELLSDEAMKDSQAILMDAYAQSTIIYLELKDLKNAELSLAAYYKVCRQLRIRRFIADSWILKSDYLQQLDEKHLKNFKTIETCFIRAGKLIINCNIPADIGEWFYKYLLFLKRYQSPAKFKRVAVKAQDFFYRHPNPVWQKKIADLTD